MGRPKTLRASEIAALLGATLLVGAARFTPSSPRARGESPASQPAGAGLWAQVDRGPAVRTAPAMAYGGGSVTVVFGGSTGAGPLGDTWGWDGAHWTPLADLGPSARDGASFVYDSARQKGLLFGGAGTAGASADTWQWSGTAWTDVTPAVDAAVGPSPRAGAAIAFDSVRNVAVLFGGTGDASGETWEWNGDLWTRACTTAPCNLTKPPARSYAAATFDSARGQVVLFGGSVPSDGGTTVLDDTWEWDGTSWTPACLNAACTASVPPGRSAASFAYDAATQTSVLFGGAGSDATLYGDTWVWNGTTWSGACASGCVPAPRPQSGQAMAYDPTRARIVLQGTSGKPDGETWEWDGTGWTQWAQQNAPQPYLRDGHAMAFDEVRSRVVLFGGFVAGTAEHTFGDTWEWDGYEWVAICGDGALTSPAVPICNADTNDAGTSLLPRYAHALAYDAARGVTVLFGGLSVKDAPLNDTWLWDGTAWTTVPLTLLPDPRYGHALAYDRQRQVIVLFGGQGATALESDTWEWNGTAWTSIPTAPNQTPPPRSHHALAYDPARGLTVLFGGVSADATPLGDTWEWDGTTWQESFPSSSPPPRVGGTLAFDPTRQVIVLFGGETGAVGDADTWDWDGTNWTLETPPLSPPARTAHAVAYDGANRRLLLYGGFGDTQYLADTWAHYDRGEDCDGGSSCDTAACVDGVCCAASCGPCEACNLSAPGECQPFVGAAIQGTVDPGSCEGKSACDPAGRCRLQLGQPCTVGSDCVSDLCVDKVCCNSPCTGACVACSAALKASGADDGVCGDAPVGATDPHGQCRDEGDCSCGNDGKCDGVGRCRNRLPGSACGCGADDAGSGSQVCDGLGTCTQTGGITCNGDHLTLLADGGATDCGRFRCVTGAGCLTTCASGADCAGENLCIDHACAAPPSAPSAGPPGSCAIGNRGLAPGAGGAWAVGLALASLLRRRRRERGAQ